MYRCVYLCVLFILCSILMQCILLIIKCLRFCCIFLKNSAYLCCIFQIIAVSLQREIKTRT